MDFRNIKPQREINSKNKLIEKESNELRSQIGNLRNDIKRAKRNPNSEYESNTKERYHSVSGSPQRDQKRRKSMSMENIKHNEIDNYVSKEYQNLTKKFQHFIVHLQNEYAKIVMSNYDLIEENKRLKEQLKEQKAKNILY